MERQRVALLGSTGSIGVQPLDIVRENSKQFEITTLTAYKNWQMLAQQAIEFGVDSVVIADQIYYGELKEALAAYPIKVYSGDDAVAQVAAGDNVDIVVNALVGYAGLMPTVAAVKKSKKIALANKESLVVGGEVVMRLAEQYRAPILPIDSEHSAIFQCLIGEHSPLRRLIITCSGGSLRDLPIEALRDVTPEQALRHPQWTMGAKITIDSSTLVNKGFEVIEAAWLFGLDADKISVIQHPQSVVHSMVEFEDGAIKAQLGTPDMHMPISFALMFPHRAVRDEHFSFAENPTLTFAEVDRVKYPALDIAYNCLRQGGTAACTMNGANEVAVASFLAHKCGYLDIVRSIEYALDKAQFVKNPTLEDFVAADIESRRLASEFLKL
ncbi:MAG: 1-deoxy-D-xylulose-5-phosphate reductoisomerase [Alistipes sp.]|nr:1-deoxy-D-xylulose-5-phosphate reductoisomerase [Alistipes sp.]